MTKPITWGEKTLALLGGAWGCNGNPGERPQDATTPTRQNTPPPEEDGGVKENPSRTPYEPPSKPFFPQAVNSGIFYHPRLVNNSQEMNLSFPVALQCLPEDQKCYFGLGTKLFSFSTNADTIANNNPLTVTEEMDFSPEVDGQETYLADLLINSSYVYALYGEFTENNAGIIVRRKQGGGFVENQSLNVTCPSRLLENDSKIWASASNCIGANDFGDGKIIVLEEEEAGTLRKIKGFTTTQLNPQQLGLWRLNNQNYLLAVETGHATLAGEILTESGVEVFGPRGRVERDSLGYIPLGLAAADVITISSDNQIAFLGSQYLPELYALDLGALAQKIEARNPSDQSTPTWEDVAIATAENAIPLSPFEQAFISSIQYDDATKTVLASSFNDGLVQQVEAGYTPIPGVGVSIAPDFGVLRGNYFCNGLETRYCGPLFLMESGAAALTGSPAAATFLPNERLGR